MAVQRLAISTWNTAYKTVLNIFKLAGSTLVKATVAQLYNGAWVSWSREDNFLLWIFMYII